MRIRTRTAALLALLPLAACETPMSTEPTLETVRAEAPLDNSGNGVVFNLVQGPITLAALIDEAGNYCEIGFSAQSGGQTRSDFTRQNNDGTLSTHTSDKAASLSLRMDGVEYEGLGHATAVATLDASRTTYTRLTVSAMGRVYDGDGNAYSARCSGKGHNAIDFEDVVISVNE